MARLWEGNSIVILVMQGTVIIFQYGMAEMVVERLWTENPMVILFVVDVMPSLYTPLRKAGDSCGKVVGRKMDGLFGCGVCNG